MSQDNQLTVEEAMRQLPVDPSVVPQLSWSFLLGVAATELLRLGASPDEIHQMVELTLRQKIQETNG
jgi:hypothetical protein